MLLDDRLYRDWLLQLRTWATDGRLLVAGVTALRLKPGPATAQLKRIVDRLAQGNTRDLPPIAVLPERAMAGAMGAYVGTTRTIYLNRHWLNNASTAAVQTVLTEELGHHLDQVLSKEDTQGDEGEVFANLLVEPTFHLQNRHDHTEAENDRIKILVNGESMSGFSAH